MTVLLSAKAARLLTSVRRDFSLLIYWGSFLADVIFRKGSAHSKYGTDYTDRVRSEVNLIRKRYSKDVPILLCADSGFADQKAYDVFEQDILIHYITTGKLYNDVTEYVKDLPIDTFGKISKDKAVWQFAEYASRLKS